MLRQVATVYHAPMIAAYTAANKVKAFTTGGCLILSGSLKPACSIRVTGIERNSQPERCELTGRNGVK